ncbi:MAG: hypothetical protein Unbinned6805contig1000_15 [Prokaryotic dsDNA virus sp.]|nr:MAG: hypothetical protein Unbinned6805contig1000_15 [Prokaryotic dsDNA virus sp.]|tara:strand:- start:21819 stop:22043 length:225 start_codon:yes stop_codon:yes gene_type:complete
MKHTKVTGTLNNWRVQVVTEEEFIIWGEVYGDVHQRFSDGALIHTSGIKNRIVKEGDVVHTRNSKYLLGNKQEI